MKRKSEKTLFTTKAIAFCAISAALGTAVMLLGGIVPIFTYCSPLIASLFLIPAVELYGTAPAVVTWIVTSVLSLLIGADKEAAFFYVFFGWYPVLKPYLDSLKPGWLRFVLKIFIFSVSTAVMYWLTCFILGIDEIVTSFSSSFWLNAAFLAAIVLCMMLFDRALIGITAMFRARLKKQVK